MHLTLLRHTKPAVASSICYGNQNVPLAESAETDIEAVTLNFPAVDRLISSPLSRCRQLAECIAVKQGLMVEHDPQLIEMDFGRWQGCAWDDIPRQELDSWAEDFLHAKPHQGESVADLRARVTTFLGSLAPDTENQSIGIVSHAGVIRSILAVLKNEDERRLQIDYGEWVQVTYLAR